MVAVLSSDVSAVPLVAVTVIVAVPTPWGMTRPLLSTVATVGSLVLQATLAFASPGVTVACKYASEPRTNNSKLSWSMDTLVTSGLG